MTEKTFVIVDVFAEKAFSGNQLAVFVDGSGLDGATMQRAASEMNYSETTFLLPPESPDEDLGLRIFTPRAELPFAGHPIVGSGFVAAARRLVPCDPSVIRFRTGVGIIEVRPDVTGNREGSALMRQPLPTVVRTVESAQEVADIAGALNVEPSAIATTNPVAVLDNGLRVLIVPMVSLDAVAALETSLHDVRRVCERYGARTLLAFTLETVDPDSSAHCRVFAPAAGVGEDPATGSANGPLGFYLASHGLARSDELVSEQGYEMGRPSKLRIVLEREGGGDPSAVHVGGGVFVTADGAMYL